MLYWMPAQYFSLQAYSSSTLWHLWMFELHVIMVATRVHSDLTLSTSNCTLYILIYRINIPELPQCHLRLLTKLYWMLLEIPPPQGLPPTIRSHSHESKNCSLRSFSPNAHLHLVLLFSSSHINCFSCPYFPHRLLVVPGHNKYTKSDFSIEYCHLEWLIYLTINIIFKNPCTPTG